MCKYINFNNLRKKKRFAGRGGGVAVEWSLFLWKHKKQLRKYKKKKEKTRKTIYSMNNEQTMKTSFLLFLKKWFLRIRKTQKTKTHPLP